MYLLDAVNSNSEVFKNYPTLRKACLRLNCCNLTKKFLNSSDYKVAFENTPHAYTNFTTKTITLPSKYNSKDKIFENSVLLQRELLFELCNTLHEKEFLDLSKEKSSLNLNGYLEKIAKIEHKSLLQFKKHSEALIPQKLENKVLYLKEHPEWFKENGLESFTEYVKKNRSDFYKGQFNPP